MRVCSLASVKNRIVLGEPLAFSVRDEGQLLLLARGQVIADEAQLEELFRRGARVEIAELAQSVAPPRRRESAERSLEQLAEDWEQSPHALRRALSAAPEHLAAAVHAASDQLLGLIQRAPNLALAQVVRHPSAGAGHYGVNHSIHAATACRAAANFLGWSEAEQRRAFQAALTMNLSMVELQGKLADQVSPLTSLQREAIQDHPRRSAEMLAAAGIEDSDWLHAVAQHHEVPDGSGYPQGLTDITELAQLLRYADVYTARLSSRANRPAMSAQQAGRELHQMAAESPLAGALIKAFGIFPPGSLVRLSSGEMGLVVRNGDKAYHPLVSALTNADGEPRRKPLLRDSARADHSVVALLSAQNLPMRLSDERVAALIGVH